MKSPAGLLPWRSHWPDDWQVACRDKGVTFIERAALLALLDHQWRMGHLPSKYEDVRGLLIGLGAPSELFNGKQPKVRVAKLCDDFFPLVSPDEVRRNEPLHQEWLRARERSRTNSEKGRLGASVRYGRAPLATPPHDQEPGCGAVPLDARSHASEALSASSDADDGSGSDDDEEFDDAPF